jgi:hypothetical protein
LDEVSAALDHSVAPRCARFEHIFPISVWRRP